jgi:hypothetical protein
LTDGEDAAVAAQRRPRRPEFPLVVRSGVERAAEAAGAGKVPDGDLAVHGGGIERRVVTADRQSGDLPGMALEGFAGGGVLDVPDDDARVLGGGDRDGTVGAEGRLDDRAVVASRGRADLAGDEVEEAHRAVAAAEQHRAVVGAQGRLVGADRQAPQRVQRAGVADHGGAAPHARDHAPAVARDHERDHAGARVDVALRAERSAAARVEALDARAHPWTVVDGGEQRAPVGREAQAVDELTLEGAQSKDAMGASVHDGRRIAADREP